MAADLAVRAPGLIPIKGLEVAALYPDGFVRTMNDLDYLASAQSDVWAAVAALTSDGWSIDTATFSHFDDGLQVMVSMRRTPEDPYQLPYGVEIATSYALGDLGGVGPLADLPTQWRRPPIKNLLMLLYERFEQLYRARDLIDAALLVDALTPDGYGRGLTAPRTRCRGMSTPRGGTGWDGTASFPSPPVWRTLRPCAPRAGLAYPLGAEPGSAGVRLADRCTGMLSQRRRRADAAVGLLTHSLRGTAGDTAHRRSYHDRSRAYPSRHRNCANR